MIDLSTKHLILHAFGKRIRLKKGSVLSRESISSKKHNNLYNHQMLGFQIFLTNLGWS